MQAQPGAGIDEGKAHIGFSNTITTVDGLAGRPPYPIKITKVCQVANLYPQYYQVVVPVDVNINSIADLKGKVLVTQPKDNTPEIINMHMLQVFGMNYQSLSKVNFIVSYTDAVSMVKDGHAQVFTLGTTVPALAVMDLASARDIKLIGIDEKILAAMKKINPGYSKLTIKAGIYPKLRKDVDVIGYATHIVASCDLPEDMVYKDDKDDGGQCERYGDIEQGDLRADAEDHGRGHRCASPQGRPEILQGSGSDVNLEGPATHGIGAGRSRPPRFCI